MASKPLTVNSINPATGAMNTFNYLDAARDCFKSGLFIEGCRNACMDGFKEQVTLPDMALRKGGPVKATLTNINRLMAEFNIILRIEVTQERLEILLPGHVEMMLAEFNITLSANERRGLLHDLAYSFRITDDAGLDHALAVIAERGRYSAVAVFYAGLVPPGGKTDWIKREAACFKLTDESQRPLFEKALRAFRIQAVQAAMQGEWDADDEGVCSLPYVLVLIGGQGVGKTRYVEHMLPKPFTGTGGVMSFPSGGISASGRRDMMLPILSRNIQELGESDMSRRNVDDFKRELGVSVDMYRMPYGRDIVLRPRRTVFIATSNRHDLLVDRTGNRRFWVFAIEWVDIEAVVKLRDRAAAQAYKAWSDGETWVPGKEMDLELAAGAEAYSSSDPIEEAMTAALGPWMGCQPDKVRKTDEGAALFEPMTVSEVIKMVDLDQRVAGSMEGMASVRQWLDEHMHKRKNSIKAGNPNRVKTKAWWLPKAEHWSKSELTSAIKQVLGGYGGDLDT